MILNQKCPVGDVITSRTFLGKKKMRFDIASLVSGEDKDSKTPIKSNLSKSASSPEQQRSFHNKRDKQYHPYFRKKSPERKKTNEVVFAKKCLDGKNCNYVRTYEANKNLCRNNSSEELTNLKVSALFQSNMPADEGQSNIQGFSTSIFERNNTLASGVLPLHPFHYIGTTFPSYADTCKLEKNAGSGKKQSSTSFLETNGSFESDQEIDFSKSGTIKISESVLLPSQASPDRCMRRLCVPNHLLSQAPNSLLEHLSRQAFVQVAATTFPNPVGIPLTAGIVESCIPGLSRVSSTCSASFANSSGLHARSTFSVPPQSTTSPFNCQWSFPQSLDTDKFQYQITGRFL